jgi:L-fuculose-phosphate aldolase
MAFDLIHPREQLVRIMERVYQFGMTTTSGGNLSIREENGDIWITPAGVDKGSLGWDDIVHVLADGTVKGRHRPSSELPFHRAIYRARPDMRAIVHAHPRALVSFSIVRRPPPVDVLPQAVEVCRRVEFAPYALPGSEQLGENIARTFANGADSVMLENHGVACGGVNLLDAFRRFETLDFCARIVLQAHQMGPYRRLTPEQIALSRLRKNNLPEFDVTSRCSKELALRRHIVQIVSRSCKQQLMNSTEGVVSIRLDEESFLITPTGKDRALVGLEDIVLIRSGHRERGKMPSRSVILHQRLYADHPHIEAIVTGQPPASTAFAISEQPFDTRTIPESYILLRDVSRIPFGPQFNDEARVSAAVSPRHPVVLLENDAILCTGRSLLEAFDRLEVAEFTARSLTDAIALGGLVAMGDAEIADLRRHFLGE